MSIGLHSVGDYFFPKNVPVDQTNLADLAPDVNIHNNFTENVDNSQKIKRESLLTSLWQNIYDSIWGTPKEPGADPILPTDVVSEPATPTEKTFVDKGKAVVRTPLEDLPFSEAEGSRPRLVRDATELMNSKYAELNSPATDNDLTPTNSVILPSPPSPSPVTDALRETRPNWDNYTPPNSPGSLRRAASFTTGGLTPPTTTI